MHDITQSQRGETAIDFRHVGAQTLHSIAMQLRGVRRCQIHCHSRHILYLLDAKQEYLAPGNMATSLRLIMHRPLAGGQVAGMSPGDGTESTCARPRDVRRQGKAGQDPRLLYSKPKG